MCLASQDVDTKHITITQSTADSGPCCWCPANKCSIACLAWKVNTLTGSCYVPARLGKVRGRGGSQPIRQVALQGTSCHITRVQIANGERQFRPRYLRQTSQGSSVTAEPDKRYHSFIRNQKNPLSVHRNTNSHWWPAR